MSQPSARQIQLFLCSGPFPSFHADRQDSMASTFGTDTRMMVPITFTGKLFAPTHLSHAYRSSPSPIQQTGHRQWSHRPRLPSNTVRKHRLVRVFPAPPVPALSDYDASSHLVVLHLCSALALFDCTSSRVVLSSGHSRSWNALGCALRTVVEKDCGPCAASASAFLVR